jgi:hypothetical protein
MTIGPRQLLESGLFDPVWYRQAHDLGPVEGDSDLAAATHFLTIGLPRAHDPGPEVDLRFQADVHGLAKGADPNLLLQKMLSPGAVDPSRLPWALDRLLRRGRADLALRLADRLLPVGLSAFRHILVANAASARGQADGWVRALNAYLSHHGVGEITLRGANPGEVQDIEAAPQAIIPDGPLVTVILCAWQAEATVEASLKSVLSQGWRNIEVIAVDDASTDATPAILDRIAQQDSRVRVVHNPVNVGPYVGRNIALGLARGRWICCHDADEWAHPDRLSSHMDWLRHANSPPVSQIGMLRMTPEGRFSQIGRAFGHTVDGALRECPSATLFHADVLKQRLGAWDCARFGADTEMIARAQASTGLATAFLAEPLVLSLDLPQSLTNRSDTGMGVKGKLSNARGAYRSFWQHNLSLRLLRTDENRFFQPFPPPLDKQLPPEVTVSPDNIRRCLLAADQNASGPLG